MQRELRLPRLGRDFGERLAQVDASGVDEDVDGAAAGDGCAADFGQRRRVGEVGGEDVGVDAVAAQSRGGLLEQRRAPRDEQHARTGAAERQGQRFADA